MNKKLSSARKQRTVTTRATSHETRRGQTPTMITKTLEGITRYTLKETKRGNDYSDKGVKLRRTGVIKRVRHATMAALTRDGGTTTNAADVQRWRHSHTEARPRPQTGQARNDGGTHTRWRHDHERDRHTTRTTLTHGGDTTTNVKTSSNGDTQARWGHDHEYVRHSTNVTDTQQW